MEYPNFTRLAIVAMLAVAAVGPLEGCATGGPTSYEIVRFDNLPADLREIFTASHPAATHVMAARYDYRDGTAYEMIYQMNGVQNKSRYYRAAKASAWQPQAAE